MTKAQKQHKHPPAMTGYTGWDVGTKWNNTQPSKGNGADSNSDILEKSELDPKTIGGHGC